MKLESKRFEDRPAELAGNPKLSYTTGDLRSAEDIDAALSAAAVGVEAAAIRAAWGDEAGELADIATRLAPRSRRPVPAPSAAFVRALESRVAEAFEARPAPSARARWAWRVPRFGRLTEMALVGTAAVVLVAGAFLLSPGTGIAPYGTPTAEAGTEVATGTATIATPEVAVTAAPGDKVGSSQRRFSEPSSKAHAVVSGIDDTGAMNAQHDDPIHGFLTMLDPLMTRHAEHGHAILGIPAEAPAWAYATSAAWSLPAPSPAASVVDRPAPLPSPATIEAGKRRLMALAERLRDERRGQSSRAALVHGGLSVDWSSALPHLSA